MFVRCTGSCSHGLPFPKHGRWITRIHDACSAFPPPPDGKPADAVATSNCRSGHEAATIRTLADLVQWEKAAELLSRTLQHRIELDILTFNCAMRSFAQAEQWEKAFQYLGDIRGGTLRPNVITFSTIAHACGSSQKWMQAVQIVDDMIGADIPPNVVTYSSVISACERSSRWDFALYVLSAMRRIFVSPNVISFNSTISACAKGRQWERAFLLLKTIERGSLKPTSTTYNALVSACEKGMQWQRALSIFASASRHEKKPGRSLSSFRMDIITANAVASACEKDQQWQRALNLFWSLSEFRLEPTVITFNVAISACGKGHLWQLALTMFGNIRTQLLEPSLITYNTLLGVCGTLNRWMHALAIYTEMCDLGHRPSDISLGTLATSLASGGHWRLALFALAEMQQRRLKPSMMAMSAILEQLEQDGYITEELMFLRSLHHLASHAIPIQQRLSEATLTAASCRWFQEMREAGSVSSLFSDTWRRQTLRSNSFLRRSSYMQPYMKEVCLLHYVFDKAEMGNATSVCNAIEEFGTEVLGKVAWLKVAGGVKADVLQASACGSRETGMVMEIGTYCGYSALRIAMAVPGVHVATLEVDPIHVVIARNVIAFAGLAGSVHVWTGHSQSLIPRLAKRYSSRGQRQTSCRMVFMDQQGSRYHHDLVLLERWGFVSSGTVIVADNVLKPGAPLYLWHIFAHGWYVNRVLRMDEFAMASSDWMVVSVCCTSSPPDLTRSFAEPPPELVRLSREADHMRARAMTLGSGVSFKDWASFADEMRDNLLRFEFMKNVEDVALD